MRDEKYEETVQLFCPTCGENNFEVLEGVEQTTELVRCAHCQRTLTKDELMRENSENIDEHMKELGLKATKDLAKDIEKMFKKAFKGNKNVRFK